jgi:hypothetical protein
MREHGVWGETNTYLGLTNGTIKMGDEEVTNEELQYQENELEEKQKRVSDAAKRKGNKTQR